MELIPNTKADPTKLYDPSELRSSEILDAKGTFVYWKTMDEAPSSFLLSKCARRCWPPGSSTRPAS